jgi:phosphopantothenoylcysteine decarboxylase / phosphopantothenate---cysteine ligase
VARSSSSSSSGAVPTSSDLPVADTTGARRPFAGRRVLLGVTGGIAAFKGIMVARELAQSGAVVDVVLTPGALEFVRPLSFEALTGRTAYTTAFTSAEPLAHIQLARDADAIVVAPATANFLARAAAGMADDLLAATLLATAAPVVLCPAMNDRMYAHPQTRANIDRLREIGYLIAGPAVGPLAWGEGEGPGRLLEPAEIVAHVGRALEAGSALQGRRVVVTAGPTREAIDPVRFIGNRSSGRMGYAIAEAAWRRGAEVTLISGPTGLPDPVGVEVVRVEHAEAMLDAVRRALPGTELMVMSAAVADFRPAAPSARKIKRAGNEPPVLRLEPAPDVLAETRVDRESGCVTVGFALETDSPLENARAKLDAKGLDLLVLNDATEPGAGFEVETNRVTLLRPGAEPEALPLLHKRDVADRILDAVLPMLPHRAGGTG